MQPTSATGERGFTLLELIVVLSIMVLMAGMLPLALNRMLPARRVALAAEQLTTDITWLQIRSSATGARGRIVLTPAGYRLDVSTQQRQVDLAPSTTLRFMRVDNDAALEDLTVFPDGTCSPARIAVVDSGRRVSLSISMLTGRVRRTS